MTDPLADCFTRLRNGAKARLESIKIPYSKEKEKILGILRDEGFLSDVQVEDSPSKRKDLHVRLKVDGNGVPVLEFIRRISKPGHRVYSRIPATAKVRDGLGFQILSTSRGIMTDRKAVELKVGGEVVGEVW